MKSAKQCFLYFYEKTSIVPESAVLGSMEYSDNFHFLMLR